MATLKKLIIYRLLISGISGLVLGAFMDYDIIYRVLLISGGFIYLGISLVAYLKDKAIGTFKEKHPIGAAESFVVYSLFLMGISIVLLSFVMGLGHMNYYFPVLFLGNSIVLLSVYYCWQASRKLSPLPLKG